MEYSWRSIESYLGCKELSSREVRFFREKGFLVYQCFFSQRWCEELFKALLDTSRTFEDSKSVLPHPTFIELVDHPAFISIARSLVGSDLLFHHGNGQAFPDGCPAKPWHHDYDGTTLWNGTAGPMIHLMGYPKGLKIGTGPLVVLPGSQRLSVGRRYPHQYGTRQLKGEIVITGEPGLLVVINSALWHTRRPQASAEIRPYFNFSYCEAGHQRPERAGYSEMLKTLACKPGPIVSQLTRLEQVVSCRLQAKSLNSLKTRRDQEQDFRLLAET